MLPCIKKDDYQVSTLYVKDEPFLILGGELHNSSASSVEYMERMVWPYLTDLNLNTIIVPVSWEAVERKQGEFDFSLQRYIIDSARNRKLKLIFIWFGLWKNGESFYAPGWIKRDTERYFRCVDKYHRKVNNISPFCKEAVDADAAAYSRFLRFLKEYDAQEQTVIMIQLENEIGTLHLDRDHSEVAERLLQSEVPESLQTFSSGKQNWKEAFTDQLSDYFMTWGFANAIETIAAAGKKEYPLPVYLNTWLYLFPYRPGTYPTGGPIAPMLPVWKKLAPSVDLFAPDIYHSDFDGVCSQYTADDNPLLIPEARRDPITASNAFYAFAKYKALGFSPFGIEDFENRELELDITAEKLAELNIDDLAFKNTQGTGKLLKQTYSILGNIKNILFFEREKVSGFIKKNEHQAGDTIPMGFFALELTYPSHRDNDSGSAGILIKESSNEVYLIGCNIRIAVSPMPESDIIPYIQMLEEGHFENNVFVSDRILNGDEVGNLSIGNLPSVLKITVDAMD